MLTPKIKVRPHPDVLATPLPAGEAILLQLETKAYFRLNETGARIWGLISSDLELGEVAEALEAEFDVDPAKAEESVLALVEGLLHNGLVIVIGEADLR